MAQYSIRGTLINESNILIPRATVLVFKNTTLVKFTYSDDEGRYNIKDLKPDEYRIEVSSLSYKKSFQLINLTKDTLLNFILKEKHILIDEIIIDIERDIEVRNDTIIFKTKAFNNRKGVVIEDVLKKLPGIEIDDNGVIKFQGKLVTNVKIDNDDLFDGGYSVLTKNLNAAVVEKVQVLLNYSKNPLLKNLRDTEDVAINLTLKEDRKSNFFGNFSMGYAKKEHYDSNANLISLSKKSKHFLFSDFNTIGDDVISNINGILSSKNDDKSYDLGRDERTKTFINLNTKRPIFDDRIVNFNNSKFLNLNSIFKISKDIKLKTTGLIFSDKKDYISQNNTRFLVEEPFILTENFLTKKKEKLGLGKVDLEWFIDKKNRVEYTGSYFSIEDNGSSSLTQNRISINEKLKTRTKNQNHFLHYTKKNKDSAAFVFALRYIKGQKLQNYIVTPYLYDDFFDIDIQNTRKTQSLIKNEMELISIQASFLKASIKNNWGFHLGFKKRIDNLNTKLYFVKTDFNSVLAGSHFQNDLSFSSNLYYVSSRFRKIFHKIDFSVTSSLNFKRLQIDGSNNAKNNFFIYINTNMNFKYQLHKQHEFVCGFGTNQKTNILSSTISNFTPINYRTFYRGLENNELLGSYNYYFNYRFGNWADKFTANLNMQYIYNKNFISDDAKVSIHINTIKQIVLKNKNQFFIGVNIDRYIDFLSSNIKVKLNYNRVNYKNIINNVNRIITSFHFGYGFEMRSAFSGVLNYTIGVGQDKAGFEINALSKRRIHNKMFLDLDLNISNNLSVFIKNEKYFLGNLFKSKSAFYFTNIDIQYKFKKSKWLGFARINNLFDNKSFKTFSLTDITEFSSKTKLIPRYLMFGLNYRF